MIPLKVEPYVAGGDRRRARPRPSRFTGGMRHTAEWWAKPVAELAAGGEARLVARRHGVRERTLIWWRSELRRRARKRGRSGPRLLPVVVRAAPIPVQLARADEVEVFVEVGATRMTMRGAVSAEHLAAIVSASARVC